MRWLLLMVFAILGATPCLFGEIKEAHDMEEIAALLSSLSPDSWVFFDIDYTLIRPSERVLQMETFRRYKKRFQEEMARFSKKEQDELLPLLMVTYSASELTEPAVLTLLNDLRIRNIPTFGFTAIDTSIFGDIGRIPTWRHSDLSRLGVSFENTSPSQITERIEFTQFSSHRGTFPLYEKGILYCNYSVSKGALLSAFLQKVQEMPAQVVMPTRIVLIDDRLENLQDVEQVTEQLNVRFVGVHYRIKREQSVDEDNWRHVWDELYQRAHDSTFWPRTIFQTKPFATIR